DTLFEPVRIGPVVAPNRFYQVPHCTGMGYMMPASLAAMREVKAEGGWGVVCTEYATLHISPDDAPFPSCSLWDEDDVRVMAAIAEAVHRHGALAGTQPWHGGLYAANKLTRELPFAPSAQPIAYVNPVHARAMDKRDIKALRRWQVDAVKRARRAGFDIVYVYAGHAYLPFQFIAARYNHRTDEYGGSLENRVRLLREMIDETKDAVGDTCAVAVRFAVDELMGPAGVCADNEGREVIEMLAELPDLWDVNISDPKNDSGSSRFFAEGSQAPYTEFVKSVTGKPVVGVGRFTSPDTMVSQIRRGVLDMIGAARPSIADPFLPRKIEDGRTDEIRECIGCNICRATFKGCVPIRCTQNPTMGEEWRRGWHPERIAAKGSADRVLVVGAGPAGLESARALGQRGYGVYLAEATTETGGHIAAAAKLPGLAAWGRVRDYRLQQIQQMPNVELFYDSRLSAAEILAFEIPRVVLATGSHWRRDGVGRCNRSPVDGWDRDRVLTPEQVMNGAELSSPVIIYDDDHYYMGGCLAELVRARGQAVTLVTPAAEASVWTQWTDEHYRVVPHLMRLGVKLCVSRNLVGFDGSRVRLSCSYTGETSALDCATLVMVSSRSPDDALYVELLRHEAEWEAAGIRSVTRIGDCLAPATTADAVYAGHRYARELDGPAPGDVPFHRERVVIDSPPALLTPATESGT
ncbi:MAG: NAD(P)-binding protein, partial [Gammaproteobacteria bacterium]